MKVSRNSPCACGSGKKTKNCCGEKEISSNDPLGKFKLLVAGVVLSLVVLSVFAIIQFYQSDRPEMEAYKCENPACGKTHYRPVSN